MDGNVVPASDISGTPISPYGAKAQLFVYSSPFPFPLYFHCRDVVERVCARNEDPDAERSLKVLNTQTEPRLDTRFFRFFVLVGRGIITVLFDVHGSSCTGSDDILLSYYHSRTTLICIVCF